MRRDTLNEFASPVFPLHFQTYHLHFERLNNLTRPNLRSDPFAINYEKTLLHYSFRYLLPAALNRSQIG